MSCVRFVRVGFILCMIYLQYILSTEVLLERGEVYYFNKKYFSNATAFVRRTSRKSPYYGHIEGTLLVYIGDNVTLHADFYEFLHNEYRRNFVEFDLNLCDLSNKEPWRSFFGATLMRSGFTCPLPPGTYRLHNLTISMDNFPYVWPFEKVMCQGYLKFKATQEILARLRIYANFKPKLPKGK